MLVANGSSDEQTHRVAPSLELNEAGDLLSADAVASGGDASGGRRLTVATHIEPDISMPGRTFGRLNAESALGTLTEDDGFVAALVLAVGDFR